MPRVPGGKVGVYVYIDENLYKEFRRLVFSKYENFHGVLSREVEHALRAWIAMHTQKHTNLKVINKPNPQPKVYEVFQQVKEYLKKVYGYDDVGTERQIPRKHLIAAISAVRGTDARTISKWMDLFMKYKLIKWIGGEVFEVL
ncbi:MAG: hypothetical protein QW820_06710 [Sulfolobales archaeon]